MKKWIFLSFFMAGILSCTSMKPAIKRENPLKLKGIKERLEEIVLLSDPSINLGIQVSSLKDGSIIYEKNADRLFVPASTIKVITLAAALHYLGPSYRFETGVYAEGLTSEGTQVQNIYLKGSGDPSLMDHDLYHLAVELKQMGIKRVTGAIFVDSDVFDDVLWSPGTAGEDRSRGFGAPVCGFNFNHNSILLKTMPSPHVKGLAQVLVKPASKYIKVKSNIRTRKDKSGQKLSIVIEQEGGKKEEWPNPTSNGLKGRDVVVVNGHMQQGSDPTYTSLAVRDPAMLAGNYFREQLKRLGIKVEGLVAKKAVPENALRLTSHQSRLLGEALIDFTKISNNVANDSLLKAISANDGEKPATAKGGLKLVSDFLAKEVGINPGSLITADGAGLSRYNLLSPAQMIKILNYGALNFAMAPEFMAALPIAGQDGTLSSRLRNTTFRGNIRAKTGSMSGITNLAGYISNEKGERFSFAFMINGIIGNTQKYRKLQDELIASIFADPKALATKE